MPSEVKPEEPFLYQRVYDALHDQIRNGNLGSASRLPAEADLARSFSVHTLTIRRALRMLERNGLVCRQHGRGTFVSGNPKQPPAVLYVGETETHVQRDIYIALSRLALDRAQTFSAFEMVSPSDPTPPGLAEALSGVPMVVVHSDYSTRVAPLLSAKHRLVVVGEEKADLGRPAHWVLVDRRAAISLAVDHLTALGHRNVALVIGAEWTQPLNPRLRAEYASYIGALASNGVRDYERVVWLRTDTKFQEENLRKMKEVMKAKDPPTAFLCPSDYRARPLYYAAAEMGMKIPRDFSVVGMWNTPWCTAWIPELTSIDCGIDEMARLTMILSGENSDRAITCRVEPRLVVRQSTACQRGIRSKSAN